MKKRKIERERERDRETKERTKGECRRIRNFLSWVDSLFSFFFHDLCLERKLARWRAIKADQRFTT